MGLLSNKIKREELKAGDHIYSWRTAFAYAHHGIYIGDGKVIHFTPGAGQEISTGTILDRIIFSSFPARPSDNPCPQCGDNTRIGGVILSCIDCFVYGGELYRFEYDVSRAFFLAKLRGGTCTRAPSDSPEDVIHRANFLLQDGGFGVYNVFKNNCEDFAIYCKTGLIVITSISVGPSGQAASLKAAANAIFSSPLRNLTSRYSVGAIVSSSLGYLTTISGGLAVGYGMYCVNRLASDIGERRDMTKVQVEKLVAILSLVNESLATDIPKEE